MFRAIIFLPIFRSTRLCVTACGIMHRQCCRPVAALSLPPSVEKPLCSLKMSLGELKSRWERFGKATEPLLLFGIRTPDRPLWGYGKIHQATLQVGRDGSRRSDKRPGNKEHWDMFAVAVGWLAILLNSVQGSRLSRETIYRNVL